MTERPPNDPQAEGAPSTRPGNGRLSIGWVVFWVLAALTVIEFIIAVTLEANLPVLLAIGVIKAGLIGYYFMHFAKIWRGEDEG